MPPGRVLSQTWLKAAFSLEATIGSSTSWVPPAFLCPAARPVPVASLRLLGSGRQAVWTWRPAGSQRRYIGSTVASALETTPSLSVIPDDKPELAKDRREAEARKPLRKLPLQCPGCGAFSQTTQPDQPGYFNLKRHATMVYLGLRDRPKRSMRAEEMIALQALQHHDLDALKAQGVDLSGLLPHQVEEEKGERGGGSGNADSGLGSPKKDPPTIVCQRCNDLVNHTVGEPIFHPGVEAIRETIAESPYKYNYVYHVLDAADFPMSLLPRIADLLGTMPLRSHNRRARRSRFYGDRMTELSFVITRSDLLAPQKEQVDRLMPWIRETLRDALGQLGRAVRLGNVWCVSARRNWWTTELREEIWKHGGANWLVGKANVGKSYLVNDIFPKGRMQADDGALEKKKPLLELQATESGTYKLDVESEQDLDDLDDLDNLDETALLPPRPPEVNYPRMPVASALPGTTASPIRIPFGSGKGELIDMPGLRRSGLVDYVAAKHKDTLVMKTRVQPEQVSIKGGLQSLLLGGFIRITPRTPDLVFLAYNFTPLQEHCTQTSKAMDIQAQKSDVRVENIAVPGTSDTIKLAGSFALKHDVTKVRTGPITRKDAAHISVDRLPYRVLALDLLIEGCGWVEVVAQVRTRDLFREGRPEEQNTDEVEQEVDKFGILRSLNLTTSEGSETEAPAREPPELPGETASSDWNWPIIDVFSPGGKFVGVRQPLNAWMLCKPKKPTKSRPRPSKKGDKKRANRERLIAKKLHRRERLRILHIPSDNIAA